MEFVLCLVEDSLQVAVVLILGVSSIGSCVDFTNLHHRRPPYAAAAVPVVFKPH